MVQISIGHFRGWKILADFFPHLRLGCFCCPECKTSRDDGTPLIFH